MAVIQEHPQLQVFVESNGVRLREFDGDEGEATAMTRTITKYIEAMSAEEFAVQLELHPPFPRYAMYIKLYIDGKCVRSRIIGDHQYERARGSVKRTFDDMVTKIADGHCISRKFCFSELQIEDSDAYDLGAWFTKDLSSIGTITLKTYYIENLRQVPTKDRSGDKERTGLGPIPEKALKGQALTHWTGLGAEVKVPYVASSHTTYDYVNLRRLPFATFNFKYRSRAALQSLLIIPRSPSPQHDQVKNEETIVANIPEPKQDGAVSSVKKESSLKREHSAIPGYSEDNDDEVLFVSAAKRPRLNITVNESGFEIIDLT